MSMLDTLLRIEWRAPLWAWLVLAPLVPVAIDRWRRRRPQDWCDPGLRPWALRPAGAVAGGRWLLPLVGWWLACIALAGPQWPGAAAGEGRADRSGAAIMAVVDVSGTMGAGDVAPDRLRRARAEIRDLLARLQGERLGLVAFAGRANAVLPPSRDPAVVRHYLPLLERALDFRRDAAPVDALALAADRLAATEARSRAILLVTDGDPGGYRGEAGQRLPGLLDRLADETIPVFVLQVASQGGGAVPARWLAAGEGQRVSRPDADVLEAIAARTGGALVPVADGDGDWQTLYDGGLAELPGQARRSVETAGERTPLFAAGLLPALVLLAAGLLGVRRPGMVLAVVLALGAGLLAAGQAVAGETERRPAWQAYQGENYLRAGALYAAIPGFAGRMGEGAAAHRRQDYRHAAEQFRLALAVADSDARRAEALYNLGNASARLGDYRTAESAYLGAMRYRAGFEAAEHNLWIVRALLGEGDGEMREEGDRPGTRVAEEGRYDETEERGFPEKEQAEPEELGTGTATRRLAGDGGAAQGDWRAPVTRLRGVQRIAEGVQDEPARLLRNRLHRGGGR